MLIVNYEKAFELGSNIVGGKGYNLARLARYNFKVPNGIVLTAKLYENFINNSEILALITNIEETKDLSTSNLSKLRELIEHKAFSQEEENEIEKFLIENQLTGKKLAIRSSATSEDSEKASFAGIHSSYLNISDLQEIFQAIKKCYASLWTEQAVAYRKKQKLTYKEVYCAVVICEMLEAEFAGVCFTSDPLTGRRDQMKINAVKGLAEKLVSGHVNPEDITITSQNFEVSKITRNSGEKTLTDSQLKQLYLLANRVFWALGDGQYHQDLEWVYMEGTFWLVQARPITILPYPTMEELKTYPIMWSNGNFKDAIPGIQSTMSWSNLQNTIKHILYVPLKVCNFEIPQGMEITRRFQGRMYFDLTFLQWSLYQAFNVTPLEVNNSLGGHQPEIKVPSNTTFGEKIARFKNTQKLLKAINKVVKELKNDIEKIKKVTNDYKNFDFSNLTKKELKNKLIELSHISLDFAPKFQLANNNAGASITILETIVKKIAPNDYNELCSGLLSYSGTVTSAEQGYRLFDLATIALANEKSKSIFTKENFENLSYLALNKDEPFIKALTQYLDEFGHRAVYEGEIANPRWREDPSFIIEQVRLIILSGNFENPRAKAKVLKEKTEALLKEKTFFFRPLIKKLANNVVKNSALREESKSILASLLEPVRKIYLEFGNRLVLENKIEKREDIFNLSLPDMISYILDEWEGKGAKNLILDRKKQNDLWSKSEPEDVIITDANYNLTTLATNEITIVSKKEVSKPSDKIITGVGVSAGIFQGRVRIIKHPNEGFKLEKGDILVAPSTDPGWTPLFLRAGAIIMEVGGYLSHGAIVAREYGLPAVVNVSGILNTLQDGQIVTVNGNKGTISL